MLFNPFRKKPPESASTTAGRGVSSVDRAEVAESGLFREDWYLNHYPDAAMAGVDPVSHYLENGAALGYDPGPGFSTCGYWGRYPDVASAGMNPLLHYLRHGRDEGRATGPAGSERDGFDRKPYRNFSEFLRHSLLQPLVKAPFSEDDLCSFAVMGRIGAQLAERALSCPDSEAPLVSVVMPAFNRETVIAEAIASVLRQSYGRFELIVVDDGSTDGTVSAALPHAADPRVRVERCPERRGVSAARNRGIALAKGALIAYLDSDNTWLPDYLGAMVGAFLQSPEIEAAYSGQYICRSEEPEPVAVRFGSYNKSLLRNHNYIDLNCFMHRSSALERAGGGFCETLTRLVDWELILRISRSCPMVSVPVLQSNYFHDRADNTITRTETLAPALEVMTKRLAEPVAVDPPAPLAGPVAVVVVNREGLEPLHALVDDLCGTYSRADVELIVVDNGSSAPVRDYLESLRPMGVGLVFSDLDCDFPSAANQGAALARPGADILFLGAGSLPGRGAVEALQAAVYASPDVAISVPQIVVPAGHADAGMHVPDTLDALPCDVSLSLRHRNVARVGTFHDGERVELDYAPFSCVYIKREVWDRCGGLAADGDCPVSPERILCDYVRQVLGMKIVYTPAALARHNA